MHLLRPAAVGRHRAWHPWARRAALLCLAVGPLPPALAGPSVVLAGILGSKALLVIDGQTRALGAGESAQAVRVVAVGHEDAQVEVEGRRVTLQLGGTTAQVGAGGASASGRGRRIVMLSDSMGHFRPQGTINGQSTQFLVDTGATTVALGQPEADRLGVVYRTGQPVYASTANGNVRGWRITLSSVRIGDVEVRDVEAVVMPQAMPMVLLGNSFLTQFQMTRINDQMVLERRF